MRWFNRSRTRQDVLEQWRAVRQAADDPELPGLPPATRAAVWARAIGRTTAPLPELMAARVGALLELAKLRDTQDMCSRDDVRVLDLPSRALAVLAAAIEGRRVDATELRQARETCTKLENRLTWDWLAEAPRKWRREFAQKAARHDAAQAAGDVSPGPARRAPRGRGGRRATQQAAGTPDT
jgi:hypothetical protein